MTSRIESGINTYLGHFRQLIDVCEGFGSSYSPVPKELQIANLKAQTRKIQTAITKVDTLLPDYLAAENARQEKFALLPPLATRVQATAIVLGLPNAIVVHIKEVVRKIRGERAHKLKPEPVDGTHEPARHVSVSQVSFNEQIEHLNQLIALVASQPAYTPAETDLTVAALNRLLTAMRSTNDAAMEAIVPLTAARQERDNLLYNDQTGMMGTALRVKDYVKAVFGANSPQYKEVRGIKFRNR
jgi:hypothetical protein